DMFSSSSSRVINSAELEYEEPRHFARWELPAIAPSEVYIDLSVFNLKVANRISIKEFVSQIQENSDII
ncbi:hypothetical protein PJM23_29215, partial [Mycobacterium kansasii]